MNNNIAVSLKNISKKYRLFGSIKERFKEALHPLNKKYHKEFSALSDVSLDIQKGTTVGLIGRNGSGKTTLLEIICSVLQPSTGSVEVNGRISALLELGTGFNPEFTGRDNVVLNGTLMGYTKKEIEERIHLIEEFADIGQFFDQPVRIYSSGMFVRLAFATAINIDPDILVIDEALSVGDAKFQHKCYSKFAEFQKAGKTILLVTHDNNAIIKHCSQSILLENGFIVSVGKPNDVINKYVDLLEDKKAHNLAENNIEAHAEEDDPDVDLNNGQLEDFFEHFPIKDNCGNRKGYNKNEYRQGPIGAEIMDYIIVSKDRIDPTMLYSGDAIEIYIKAKFLKDIENPHFGFSIKTIDGLVIYALNSFFTETSLKPAKNDEIKIGKFSFNLKLAPGEYFLDLGIDEKISDKKYESLDRRCSIIHLSLLEKNWFHGFVDLEADFHEVSNKSDMANAPTSASRPGII
ncbi:MAG: ABC transporter ATP-binding protein [Candidatus Zixiibacteriota bacterium]